MSALPNGWRAARLGDALAVRYGKALPASVRSTDGAYPLVGSAGRMGVGSGVPLVEAPALVIGRKGSVGNITLEPRGCWPTDTTYFVVPTVETFDLRFLYHQMTALDLRSLDSSTAVPSLRRQDLEAQTLVAPPLEEQRRIVDILEDHLSRLDAANHYLDAAQRRLRLFGRSILREGIERSADRVTLGHLIARVEAGRSFGGSAPPADPGEWGVVKVSAMTWGEFRQSENKAVPADSVDPRFEIKPGDLLVSRANTSAYVGASVLVGQTRPRLLLSDKSLRLIPHPGVDTEWLHLALSSPSARQQISDRATGTKDSMRNISQASLLAVAVPSISLDEQRSQVNKVRSAQSAIHRLSAEIGASADKSRAARRSLLAAAFSGRLTGRSSDLDRAEELAFS